MPTRLALPFVLTLVVLCATAPARAASHLWRFNEFYSSPNRKVQFIEMREIQGSNIETNISEHWFATNGYNQNHLQLLGRDLPFGTAFKKFLVGSESYAALEGVPPPDYVLPDGFLDPTGDTVVWWFYQTIVIPANVMPSDGLHSITVVDPNVPIYSLGVNSPTNFAGQTGMVPATVVPSLSPWAGTLAAFALGAGAWLMLRLSSREA
jgi:hypothetical protein